MYSYHAKFHHSIPYEYICRYSTKGDVILDPFCGSGTTLIEAKKLKRDAIGIDISPVAILSSKVNTNNYSIDILNFYYNKIIDDYKTTLDIPNIKFPDYKIWYSKNNYLEINKLIYLVRKINQEEYREFFLLLVLSIVTQSSNKRKTWNLGYIADNVKPNIINNQSPFEKFKKKYKKEIKNITFLNHEYNNQVTVLEDDTQNIVLDKKVDMVMTSPPYPFAVDFIKYHRLPSYWLGIDVDSLSKNEIGARNKRSSKKNLELFFNEMELTYIHCMNQVNENGYWVMTIADTTFRKNKVEFVDWSINLFIENGWVMIDDKIRPLQQQSMAQKKIVEEHILVFQKI